MSFPALEDAKERLAAVDKELAAIFEEAGPEMDFSKVKSVPGDTRDKVAKVRELNEKAAEIGEELEGYQAIEAAANRLKQAPDIQAASAGTEFGVKDGKSFGQAFLESQAYKGRTGGVGPESRLDIEVKTLFSTAAGWAPEFLRTGRVVDFATRPVQIIDLVPPGETSQGAVQYMEETLFTNLAAEVAEGGAYAESALQLTERTNTVRKIGTFLPVTDEQLDDVPQVRGYIDTRLPFMLRQRLDGQILTGNGTPPNLTGILNTAGIQTQAKGTDPSPDAVYKAIVKVMVTGRAMANGIVYHPTNWQDIRLLRTADGIYIWGNPSDAAPARMWGLMVAQSDAITLGTALVGDFATFSQLVTRRGVDVQISNSHGTFFVEGKQAIRADVRVALVVYRPAAFCTVTGL